MSLLKSLCFFAVIAITNGQLTEPGEACPNYPKGNCTYEEGCPASSRHGLCGSDENHIPLWCCTPSATTTALTYYIAREFPERTQCGRSGVLNQIYNGDRTKIGEYPWVAALLYVATNTTTYGGVKWGGTLITEKFVLTAVHCLFDQTAESIRVLLGDWNITSDPDPFPATAKIEYADKVINATVDKIISHELYSFKTKQNDIALLRLKTPVHFTGPQSDILLKATLHVLTKDECSKKIYIGRIHETEFCAANKNSDACEGDSGGPLMRSYKDYSSNWFQLGIVGYGLECSSFQATATVYTRVSSFVYWIIRQITPQSERDSPCTTPDNENGSCVLVNQCPVLEQQYLQPGSSSEVELIRRSLCGFHRENRTDMVCCRLSQIKRENTMEGSACKTPEPELNDGRCVRITNCPALKNASKAAREIQKSQCGFDDELLFCCKTQDIVVASEPKYLEEFSSADIPNRTICGRIRSDNTKSEYPWLAALVYPTLSRRGYYLGCAGSLINKRFVLTVASCVYAEPILKYRVLLGTGIIDCYKTFDCPSIMQNLTVEQVILHPFYHRSYSLNDIALVRLGSDVVFNDYVSPVCLPPPNMQPLRRGSEVTMAGWTNDWRIDVRSSKAHLWNAQSCIENPNLKTIHKQELCIRRNDTGGFCSGGWGGSIARPYKDQLGQNLFLEGINLGSNYCYNNEFYPYNTNVRISAYTSWILRTITETT